MGDSASLVANLHHSADNHEPSDHDITLKYPSGFVEHFSFGKRVHKRTHRYARPLLPIEDIIHTIEAVCIQNGSHTKSELDIMQAILCTGFYNRELLASLEVFPSLQDLVSNIHCPTSSLPIHPRVRPPLSPALISHFFSQLHDRIIADSASLLERSSTKTTETTYGELMPHFLSTIFLQTHLLSAESEKFAPQIFIDLGSGVGQTCLQASLETGCTSFGIEREARGAALAALHHQQFISRLKLWGLEAYAGDVVLRKGDFLKSRDVEAWVGRADVVLVNNLKLEPETDLKLRGLLERCVRKGARVVSTRAIGFVGREKGKGRERKRKRASVDMDEEQMRGSKRKKGCASGLPTPPPEEKLAVEKGDVGLVERKGEDHAWQWHQYVYEAGSVSWSGKQGLYYISTRK